MTMTNKKFDPTKPVQTRSGRPARIVCTDVKSNLDGNILALVPHPKGHPHEGEERPILYYDNGQYLTVSKGTHDLDLVNIPERTNMFVNMYPKMVGALVHSRGEADHRNVRNRLAVLEIIYEDGVPVDSIIHPVNQEEK